MLSDLEMMRQHINVLFKHNEENRMTVVNEPPYDGAPSVFVGSTRLGNVIRYSSRMSEGLVQQLERLIRTDSPVNLGKVIGILSANQQISNVWVGPAFLFPEIKSKSTQTTQITESNKELLRSYFPEFMDDIKITQPCFAVIRNGSAVSLCCSARQTSNCAEASLQTAKSYRGKGYSVDVSNAWAAEVQKQGRIALYSTSWDNFASQSVAGKLHLIQYGMDFHIT